MNKKDEKIAAQQAEIEELKRKVVEQAASAPASYKRALDQMKGLGTDRMMASGIVVQVTAISGRPLLGPVMILDGLSESTIKELEADLKRSLQLVIESAGSYARRAGEQ